jgi:thiol:disulfide interchange protein
MRKSFNLLFAFTACLFSLLNFSLNAQIELPEDKVKCVCTISQNGEDATIEYKVTVVPHWHVNALVLPEGSFGYKSTLGFDKSPNYKLVGKTIEPKPILKFDEEADEQLAFHEGTFTFKQKIKINSEKDFTIKGFFDFQTCNNVKCLPPAKFPFKVDVKGFSKENKDEKSEIIPTINDVHDDSNQLESEPVIENTNEKDNADSKSSIEEASSKDDQSTEKEEKKKRSLLATFLISFISGLAALFTPCVFPMIPMTVSFFTKQSKTKAKAIKNGLIFGLSIIIIYILLGTTVTAIFGEEALNNMSTDPWFNFIFFVLLIVFAVSFLGAFEIRMPSKWVNNVDAKADKGGMIGIFFMALALALVSFSCTGPIVGTLIVDAARIGGITPIVGMFGFSFALALPFALFAIFPGWLNTMPKSGGWLNSVKVVLGFLELALAFKFLSNADMTWDLHMLEREVFLAIWIAIFTVLTLYLFGKIRMPHDSPLESLPVGRVLLGSTTLIFVIYMIPGLFGAPLKIISAFPPPLQYSESPLGFGGGGVNSPEHGPEGTHLGPQNIYVFHDYDLALAHAKKVNKPLFVDFTGINCVNCRKMEQQVWGEKGIIEKLKNEVVIVSLHVDELVELPENEKGEFEVYPGKTMKLETTGDKWKMMQIKKYNILAQPYYVLHDTDGNDIKNGSADYENHSNPEKFQKWLDKGLELSKK